MNITSTEAIQCEPLQSLYARLVREEVDPDELIAIVERRGKLAAAIYALHVADLAQQDLDAMREVLLPALEEDPEADAAKDAAEREFARVQLDTVEQEIERREQFLAKVQAGQQEAPARTEVLSWMLRLGPGFEEHGETAELYESFQSVLQVIRQARPKYPAGAQRVAAILREVEALPSEGTQPNVENWLRGMMALELLTNDNGFGGVAIETDEVTRSEANGARRLFYATQRQDPRYEHLDFPLDLPAGEIADLIDSAHRSAFDYANEGHPEQDLQRYLTPSRREERGRPTPDPQIVDEASAQQRATAYGGVQQPMVFMLPPQERALLSKQIWTDGLPPVPNGRMGITLSSGAGDPRVRWGASSFAWGLLCAVALRPNEILHIHDPKNPDDDEIFEKITRRATSLAREEPNAKEAYPRILRELLLEEGYQAFKRWDKWGQLTMLNPSPETLMVIRESVPPFMRAERPLEIPQVRPIESLEGGAKTRALTERGSPPISLTERRQSQDEGKRSPRRM